MALLCCAPGNLTIPATVGPATPVTSGKVKGVPFIRHTAASAKIRASILVLSKPYSSDNAITTPPTADSFVHSALNRSRCSSKIRSLLSFPCKSLEKSSRHRGFFQPPPHRAKCLGSLPSSGKSERECTSI